MPPELSKRGQEIAQDPEKNSLTNSEPTQLSAAESRLFLIFCGVLLTVVGLAFAFDSHTQSL